MNNKSRTPLVVPTLTSVTFSKDLPRATSIELTDMRSQMARQEFARHHEEQQMVAIKAFQAIKLYMQLEMDSTSNYAHFLHHGQNVIESTSDPIVKAYLETFLKGQREMVANNSYRMQQAVAVKLSEIVMRPVDVTQFDLDSPLTFWEIIGRRLNREERRIK